MKLCMVVLVVVTLLSGCSKYEQVSGKTTNWQVEVIEIAPQKDTNMIQTTIQYIGKEDSINNFKFKFSSDAISLRGQDFNPSLPFATTISTNPKTPDPLSEPIKLTIEWNNQIEEITLQ
jgi:hypothetical protein